MRSRTRSAGFKCQRRPVRGPCCTRAEANTEVGAAPTAFAVSGLVASPIVLASCWALKTTGEGLPPGPGGIFGEVFLPCTLMYRTIVKFQYTVTRSPRCQQLCQSAVLHHLEVAVMARPHGSLHCRLGMDACLQDQWNWINLSSGKGAWGWLCGRPLLGLSCKSSCSRFARLWTYFCQKHAFKVCLHKKSRL